MLEILLREDLDKWESLIADYEQQALSIKISLENSVTTLSELNSSLDMLYTKATFDFSRTRVNKDAINRYLKSVLDDLYAGTTDKIRKAAAIRYAKEHPVPAHLQPLVNKETVDLYSLQYHFEKFYYAMEAVMKSLEAKTSAKITNNSLLKLEKEII